jgi:hypothetical protein
MASPFTHDELAMLESALDSHIRACDESLENGEMYGYSVETMQALIDEKARYEILADKVTYITWEGV